MTPLLSEQSMQRQMELEARSTSGSTLLKTTTALAMMLLLGQPGSGFAAMADRRFAGAQTIGTGAEVRSLKITEADLFSQINRIYDQLLREQMELDMDSRHLLYKDLWNLYS